MARWDLRSGDEYGYLVRDADGCWAITAAGLVMRADCRFETRDGARHLQVAWDQPCPSPPGTCRSEHDYRVVDGKLVD
jgi:hypothetical protein